jgi:hypothetical protein
MNATWIIAAAVLLTAGANAANCPAGQAQVARVSYEASMPTFAAFHADWPEVQRHYPQARGITRSTVLIGDDKVVEIDEGIGIAVSRSEGIALKMRGKPYPLGYKHVQRPIKHVTIRTREAVIWYDAIEKRGTRTPPGDDSQAASPGGGGVVIPAGPLDERLFPAVGKQQYAGMECMARKVNGALDQAQACIRDIKGWPITLYFQHMDSLLTKELQWKRAVKFEQQACVAAADLAVSRDVTIEDDAASGEDEETDDED